jgi:hypothetical protein
MAVGDIFRVALVGMGAQGQQLVNVLHYRQEDSLIFDEPGEDFVEAWTTAVQTPYLATFAPGCGLYSIEVRGVTDPEYGYDYTVPGSPVGTAGSGDELPPQDAAVITWKTGKVGRANRGRSYMWPAPEASQHRGAWNATYQGYLAAYADAAMLVGSPPVTAGWQLGVLSWYLDGVKRATPKFTPVTSYVVRDQVFTQRRRRAGSGN